MINFIVLVGLGSGNGINAEKEINASAEG